MMKERWVAGNEGLKLYVREWSEPSTAPTVVLVHGYPDTSDIWVSLIERLQSRYHLVTYDVRGAGRSQAGWMFGGYELHHLVGDLAAVIQATVPKGDKVHLVGHDWGSIQGWEAVTTDKIAHRIASYTFFGAPCLDHAGHWLRHQVGLNPFKLARLTSQLSRSWYIAAFHSRG
jgi:pimeloyl-ACP methyl ester carboxylesterase